LGVLVHEKFIKNTLNLFTFERPGSR
jgi:hypothetical protein